MFQMLNVKKFIVFLVVLITLMSSSMAFAATDIGNLPAEEKNAIQELVDQGILSGYTDGTFRPKEALQRQHFAKYIVNALGLEPYYPATPTFQDVMTDMALYAYVEAAAKAGLIKGTAVGRFEPSRSLKKGEAAVIIVRALEGSQGTYASQVTRAKEIGLLGASEDPGVVANRGGAAVSISKGIKLLANPIAKLYKQGTYLVGVDIEPGLYKSDGGITYLERLRGLSGEFGDIISNEAFPSGQIYMEIKPSDKAFKFSGSGTFYKLPDDYEGDKLTSFEDGWYIVGKDILPGTYRSEQGADYYARLSGFSGEFSDIITNEAFVTGTVIVEIKSSDVGFMTRGASWVMVDQEAPSIAPLEEGPGSSVTSVTVYLNQNLSTVETPLETLKLNYYISQNNINMLPYDYSVNIGYGSSMIFNDLQIKIGITQEQKDKTINILKTHASKVYDIVATAFPNKKIEGSYFDSWYKYPSLQLDLITRTYYSWKNYSTGDYSAPGSTYDNAILTEFHFTPEKDD